MEGVEPPINPAKLIACRNCGHLNKRSARNCEKCGYRFGWAEIAESYTRPYAKSLGLIILLILPILVVILAAFSIIADHFGYGNAAKAVVNTAVIIIGVLGLAILGIGVLVMMSKRRPR